jgi:hypothetical protein
MKQILLLAILTLFFSSCKPILTNTFGRYQVKKMHNGGTVSATNYTVEVPFKIISGQIILKVYADKNAKTPLNFLFDTDSYSGISIKKYEQFKGDFADLRTKNFDNNKVATETEVYLVEKLYIGDLLVENFKLTVDEYVNKNLDGVIGADFMKDKIFTFDFPNNKLLISDISPEENANDYPFELKKDWRKVYSTKINIEGQEMNFVFDTGRTGFLETTDKFEFIGDKQTSYELIGRNIKGYQSGTVTYIETQNLAFNNFKVDNAIIIKSSDYNINSLGTKILMDNKVILDCNKMQMMLKLKDEKIKLDAKEFPTHSFAFGWIDGLKVVHKKVEVLAIDLELFDEIIQINGNEVRNDQEKVAELMESLKNERIWYLKIKRDNRFINVQVPPSILEY